MILDASVAAKWVLADEDLAAEARLVRTAMLQRRVGLAAPAVLWIEVAHAIIRAVRRERLDHDEARALADELLDVQPLVEALEVDVRDTVRTALRAGVGAYDAQYLALGARLATAVITADRQMWERGRSNGYDVVWLGDLWVSEGALVDTPRGYADDGVALSHD